MQPGTLGSHIGDMGRESWACRGVRRKANVLLRKPREKDLADAVRKTDERAVAMTSIKALGFFRLSYRTDTRVTCKGKAMMAAV